MRENRMNASFEFFSAKLQAAIGSARQTETALTESQRGNRQRKPRRNPAESSPAGQR